MKKLTKEDLKQMEDLAVKSTEAYENLREAIDKYNEVLLEMKEFTASIHERQQEYFDDRSEKWQESDAAQDYSSYMEEWENWEADEVEMPEENGFEDLPVEVQ